MITPKDILKARLLQCKNCDSRSGDGRLMRCKECGCFLEAKARLVGQTCPLGKWQEVHKPVQELKMINTRTCCGGR